MEQIRLKIEDSLPKIDELKYKFEKNFAEAEATAEIEKKTCPKKELA